MKSKIIGLQRKKVKLSSYNLKWKELYKKEQKLIYSAIEKYILDIQHIGSTSIPKAKAKPIIDIAVGVKSFKVGEKCVKSLEKIGYEYKHDAGVKGRHFFVKGKENNRTHYLHIEKLNGRLWREHILFRNYLMNHKEAIEEYNKLKEGLVKKYKDDRDTYTKKKNSFIQKILRKAEKEIKSIKLKL